MSELIYPRSPKEQMDGWSYLPRFLDKVRLHLAGKLHADYQPNFAHKGFDAAWLEAAGLKAEDFIAAVKGTLTDGQVFDWVRQNVKKSPADKAKFNAYLLNRGREEHDPAIRERLKQRKAEAGLALGTISIRLWTSSTPTRSGAELAHVTRLPGGIGELTSSHR